MIFSKSQFDRKIPYIPDISKDTSLMIQDFENINFVVLIIWTYHFQREVINIFFASTICDLGWINPFVKKHCSLALRQKVLHSREEFAIGTDFGGVFC